MTATMGPRALRAEVARLEAELADVQATSDGYMIGMSQRKQERDDALADVETWKRQAGKLESALQGIGYYLGAPPVDWGEIPAMVDARLTRDRNDLAEARTKIAQQQTAILDARAYADGLQSACDTMRPELEAARAENKRLNDLIGHLREKSIENAKPRPDPAHSTPYAHGRQDLAREILGSINGGALDGVDAMIRDRTNTVSGLTAEVARLTDLAAHRLRTLDRKADEHAAEIAAKDAKAAEADRRLTESLASVHRCMCTDARDWSLGKRDAWIYGVIVGWDEAALAEVAKRHQWPAEDVDRLRKLHAEVARRKPVDPWE
ncbi:hypothetical protein [Zavarzinia sp.]|uniref:hypothetical protein n=1 Tax=Zavarzinia sp. TaxID=2027920 RepID=UPI003568CDCD